MSCARKYRHQPRPLVQERSCQRKSLVRNHHADRMVSGGANFSTAGSRIFPIIAIFSTPRRPNYSALCHRASISEPIAHRFTINTGSTAVRRTRSPRLFSLKKWNKCTRRSSGRLDFSFIIMNGCSNARSNRTAARRFGMALNRWRNAASVMSDSGRIT